jgi:hypothetical protein
MHNMRVLIDGKEVTVQREIKIIHESVLGHEGESFHNDVAITCTVHGGILVEETLPAGTVVNSVIIDACTGEMATNIGGKCLKFKLDGFLGLVNWVGSH